MPMQVTFHTGDPATMTLVYDMLEPVLDKNGELLLHAEVPHPEESDEEKLVDEMVAAHEKFSEIRKVGEQIPVYMELKRIILEKCADTEYDLDTLMFEYDDPCDPRFSGEDLYDIDDEDDEFSNLEQEVHAVKRIVYVVEQETLNNQGEPIQCDDYRVCDNEQEALDQAERLMAHLTSSELKRTNVSVSAYSVEVHPALSARDAYREYVLEGEYHDPVSYTVVHKGTAK